MRRKRGESVIVRSDSASNSEGAKVAPARRVFQSICEDVARAVLR
jgi:hypothetical protein